MISHRYAKSNQPDSTDYNPDEPLESLIYLDANALYSWAMRNPLPTSDFEWMDPEQIQSFNPQNTSDEDDQGYILEVDLDYPTDLHDLHSGILLFIF